MSFIKPIEEHYRYTPEAKRRKIVRQLARIAMLKGDIVPLPCEVCGESRVEMHHIDYSNPYNIVFLCRKHHMEVHNQERHAKVNKNCKDCGLPKEPHRIVKAVRCLKCHREYCRKAKFTWKSYKRSA